jgi:hypothetical protein
LLKLEVAEDLAEEGINDEVKDPLIGTFQAWDKHGNLENIYGLVESAQGIEIVSLFKETKAFDSLGERASLISCGSYFNAKEFGVVLSNQRRGGAKATKTRRDIRLQS